MVPIISLSQQFSLINCRNKRTIFCKNFEISYFHKNKNICCPQLLIYIQLLTGGLTCDLYQSVAHLSRVQQTNTSLFIYILTKRLRPVFVLPLFRNQWRDFYSLVSYPYGAGLSYEKFRHKTKVTKLWG